MNGITLELQDVTTGYRTRNREHKVGIHLSGTLTAGTLTALLGTNGAGKSTLLRTLCGFQPPLSGQICLMGKNLTDYTREEMARTISVVLTERERYGEELTVAEAVALGRLPYTGFWNRQKETDFRATEKALELTGLKTLRERRLHSLSDGERQKAMIAKALAQQTPVILLDEPTSFLDFPSKLDTFRLLKELAHQEGKTVVISTHSMALALQTADTLWVMKRGQGMQTGSPRQLADRGVLDEFFSVSGVRFDRERLTYTIEQEKA